MNSRERIKTALSHKQPDKLPVDFGSTYITGMHASIVYKLRQHYGLDKPGTPVKIIEPYQMLGEVKDDLKKIIGVDCTPLFGRGSIFMFPREGAKEWKLDDGTPVLVSDLFNTEKNEDGSLFQYPMGDKNSTPSGKMPNNGFFHDAIIRQEEFDDGSLDPKDNIEEHKPISDEELDYLDKLAQKLYEDTDYAISGTVTESGFGDIATIPGVGLKRPKGIRSIEEWYISLHARKKYIKKVFQAQLEIVLDNYRKVHERIGDKINIVVTSATDFGIQCGLFLSIDAYRELYKPYNKAVNDWIHENTEWKTFTHTCGGIFDLIPDLIEAGFDALNPVQISAAGMDPEKLKKEYGKDITFWGGGVNTQKTFMFGTPEEVKEEVLRLIDTFNKDGGFVFSSVHNIQANVPIENVIALIEVVNENR